MIIIGERINSSRKTINEAIARKDAPFLIEEARLQLLNGASFIDINCATSMEKETEDLIWLITRIQESLGCKISIDSPNPQVIKATLKNCKGRSFINSITAEEKKTQSLLPVIKQSNSYVVALTMDDNGMAQDVEERLSLADRIIDRAIKAGISREQIYVDPLVKPISTEPEQTHHFLESIKRLRDKGIKTIGGLSNVSFGLPRRSLLNATFLKLAIECGIDAAIIDPSDNLIKIALEEKELPEEPFLLAKNALLGQDLYSMSYIKAFRQGLLNF